MAFGANMTEAIKDGVLQYIENVRAGKIDVLDAFLVGWVIFTILTVAITSWVTKIITKRRQAAEASGAVSGGHVQRQKSIRQDGKPAETCEWVNSTIAWLYMHHSQAPEFVQCWLKALNDQTKKQGSSVQVTFDRIKTGSLPPKLSDIRTDAGPRNILTVTCCLDASDVAFVIFATQQTSASVKLSTCDIHVAKLAGQVKMQVQCKVACITEEVQVTAMFDGKPDLKLTLKPQNSAMDDLVDLVIVENIVRDAIMNAMTTYTISAKNLPKDIIMSSTSYPTSSSFQPMTNMSRRQQTTLQGDAPSKPPRAHDRRLLVKVIKANGLAGGNGLACGDPYCTIEMDTPVQKHKTATVRNTANPFWDEHFLFDLANNSDVIKFTVLDRDKPPNDQFLGTAVVSMESLRTNPSTRQIIPLQGRYSQDKNITGSITLEFLFMESAEAQAVANQLHPQPSPLRSKYQGTPTKKVETERTVTPTGTVITTVTTTTARPKLTKDRKIGGPSLNEVPARVTKASINDQSQTHRSRSISPARDRESPNELKHPV
ncbi:phospholipid transfer protein C2CD2L-like isoform X2 [Ptychodera flava]|uniref:phospholipid transfer protein C2CD2L-like isoform X2 n=1 Tax=Ptychodera flava TaxID=63121 RepID=UPI003969E2EE